MMKLNNKGFVLAEMLIVTVFLMVIFSMLYANFYPILAEYEIREGYDDVDSKYAVYWLKKTIEDKDYDLETSNIDGANHYVKFGCDKVKASEKVATCESLVKSLGADGCIDSNSSECNVYITKYRIDSFKTTVKNNNSFSAEFQSYLNTLPDYTTPSSNNAKYRVIATFSHSYAEGEVNGAKYNTYATIEVRR